MARPGFTAAGMPRLPLLGAAGLVFSALLLTALVRLTGASSTVDLPASSTAVRELALFFDDTADGRVLIRDARTERVVGTILPGEGGFVRSTMRGLVRERRKRGLGPEAPFLLSARSDGRIVLTDPATGRLLDLGAYGPDNARAFVRFLDGQAGGA